MKVLQALRRGDVSELFAQFKLILRSCFVAFAAILVSVSTATAQSLPAIPGDPKVLLRAGSGISENDGADVFLWADDSGNGNDAAFNALNAYGELPPKFRSSNPDAGGESTVRFENQNALELDLGFLAGSNYTVFVVNGRDRLGLANFYIAGDSAVANTNLTLGYEQPGLLRQAHFNNDLDAVVETYTGSPVWSLDVFRFDQADGRDLYHNGTLVASDDNSVALLSNTGTTLGHFRAFGSLFWFQGDLAEVIVYDRALSSADRRQVEIVLATRYELPIDLLPEEMLTVLLGKVLGQPPGMSLADKVSDARAYYLAADTLAACSVLGAFQNQVQAQSGKKLDESFASDLTADAIEIIAEIGCEY